MIPLINVRETGINLRRIMDRRGITVKDVTKYLGLSSLQSVYHWLNGLTMPTIDNLYALSELLQVPIDDIVCGSRKEICSKPLIIIENKKYKRLYTYYRKLNKANVA